MHNLYYGQLEFLRTAKKILNGIVCSASNPDTILKAEVQLESILEYSSKKPLRLEFTAFDALKVQFFLAPRID